MREILFRGKRADGGGWVEGNLFIPDREDTPTEICIGTNIVRITYEVIPETVGQYTGLTDKNGKKIFEGDIVRNKCYMGKVEYNDDFAKFYVVYSEFSGNWFDFEGEHGYPVSLDCEVISNIHDNPELLKGA